MPLRSVTLLLAYALPLAAGATAGDDGTARRAAVSLVTHGAEQARGSDVLAWVKTVRDRKDAARACGDTGAEAPPGTVMPPAGLPDSLRHSELLATICGHGDSDRRQGPEDVADE